MILNNIQELESINISDVGVTSGCFDLLHYYHVQYLLKCKAECEYLIVGVDSDQMVLKNKNKTPVIHQDHRVKMISELRCVDAVFLYNKKQQLIDVSKDRKLFKNSDKIYGKKLMNFVDSEVIIIPDIVTLDSSSKIKQYVVDNI